MRILLIAEHDNQGLKDATFHALTAALELGEEVHVLVAGYKAHASVQGARKLPKVNKVLLADAPHLAHGFPENIEKTILRMNKYYDYIILPATHHGKNVAPRLAAAMDVAQISEISKIIDAHTFERLIYAGNVIETVQSNDVIKIITVRTTSFNATPLGRDDDAVLEVIEPSADVGFSKLISHRKIIQGRPELDSAQTIVAGGRGLRNAKNYRNFLEPLADKLGAALGATRAAVEEGYAPNNYQIGQSGKVVAPALYIAIGISGAVQHLAGIKDSKVIIAINQDSEAPIFDIADYGIAGDLFTIVPKLTALL